MVAISAIFYIEIAKERLYQPQKHGEENCRSGQTALYYSLLGILKLYAIYTPYMTDYIFQEYYRQYEKEISLHQTIWQTKTTQTEYLEFGEHVKATLTQVRKDKTQKQMSMKDPIEKLTITCPKAYREFYQKTLGDLYACTAAEKIHDSKLTILWQSSKVNGFHEPDTWSRSFKVMYNNKEHNRNLRNLVRRRNHCTEGLS